jgi:hypothetical protein
LPNRTKEVDEMTATVLDRFDVPVGPEARSQPTAGSPSLERPPTLFGHESDDELVRSGYDLARRAIGYALEDVPLGRAVAALVDEAPSRDALRMAFEYLAYMRFEDVPTSEQVDAFFLVEDARTAYDEGRMPDRFSRLAHAWRRVRSWFADAMNRWAELHERNGVDPFGGPLLPV